MEQPYFTPENPPEDYEWDREPWFKVASDAATIAGLRITTALAADGKNPQHEEDLQVFALTNPRITDAVIRSPEAIEIIRYRLAHAIAMCIDQAFADVSRRRN